MATGTAQHIMTGCHVRVLAEHPDGQFVSSNIDYATAAGMVKFFQAVGATSIQLVEETRTGRRRALELAKPPSRFSVVVLSPCCSAHAVQVGLLQLPPGMRFHQAGPLSVVSPDSPQACACFEGTTATLKVYEPPAAELELVPAWILAAAKACGRLASRVVRLLIGPPAPAR